MIGAPAGSYGTFAGKWAFASGPAPVYFMTSMAIPAGDDDVWLPGMRATTISTTESLIIYETAGGYYLQLGDLLWLTTRTDSLIYLTPDFERASVFEADLSSGETHLKVRTDAGMRPVHYSLNQTTPYLTVVHAAGTFDTFHLKEITPSLANIERQKGCPCGNFIDVNLARERLDDLDLSGADFSSANLSEASFVGSNLTRSRMNAANLLGVHFDDAVLDQAALTNCRLTGTDWGRPHSAAGINLSACRAEGAILGHAGFPLDCKGANLSDGMFSRADLREWKLSGAELKNTLLADAVLDHATLDDAKAVQTVFTRACLRGASLIRIAARGASFIDAVLDGAHLDSGTFGTQGRPFSPDGMPALFVGASCEETWAEGADFYGVNLQSINGTGAHFARATLENANLSDGLFVGTDFTQAKISGADFSGSVLISARFNDCVIGGGSSNQSCSFQQTLLQGVHFGKATLNGVLLTGSEISEADGVPLFDLPPDDERKLTQDNLHHLQPEFSAARNPLGRDAVIEQQLSWTIDNSNDSHADAPRSYFVNGELDVFDAADRTTLLFTMERDDQSLLDEPTASSRLRHIFKNNGCSLADNAPIAQSFSGWQIESTPPGDYRGAFYYPLMRVHPKSDRLAVYGAERVLLLQAWKKRWPEGIAFQATSITPQQLSENSIGPCGFPRVIVAEEKLTWQEYLTSIDRQPDPTSRMYAAGRYRW